MVSEGKIRWVTKFTLGPMAHAIILDLIIFWSQMCISHLPIMLKQFCTHLDQAFLVKFCSLCSIWHPFGDQVVSVLLIGFPLESFFVKGT
jgi:hypothetical protein